MDRDFVVLPRDLLIQFFGKMALPPWPDGLGGFCGGAVDCAGLADEITRWIADHDVATTYFDLAR